MAKKKKIYAFIDSQNLNLGTQDAGWKGRNQNEKHSRGKQGYPLVVLSS